MQSECLPNITGDLSVQSGAIVNSSSGAFKETTYAYDNYRTHSSHHSNTNLRVIKFSAKDGNPVYGGTEVRPKNYTIRIYKRTS